jgi:inosine-uridine nucleoside N-ribohydrolase
MPAVLIDTDIGDDIDDALALALALRSPELDVLGISTVFGPVAERARLARKLVAALGRPDVPVAAGLSTPLAGRNRPSGCVQCAALAPGEPLPPAYPGDAIQLISTTALAHPGQVTLIAQGPLTNIAAALRAEARLAGALAGITLMGSAIVPWPEWNTRNDPEAARIVARSGVPLRFVGMNVTLPCALPLAQVRALAALDATARPDAALLSQLIALWQRGNPRRRPILHDPLAVAAVARPALLRWAPARFGNLAEGPLRGWSWARPWPGGGSATRAAWAVRRRAFLRLFAARVIAAPTSAA